MAFDKLLTFLSIVAVASAGSLVLHERRMAAPKGFISHGAAPAEQTLTLRLGLAARNLAGLESKLTSVSTPGSSEFRQWISKDEVKSFVQPSSETVSAFTTFASANGLKPAVISPNGEWYSLALPVSQANTLFGAQFETFTNPSLNNTIMRTLSVSLPSELVGHVNVLYPTTQFVTGDVRLMPASPPRAAPYAKRQDTSCNTSNPSGIITPACLQALYGIPSAPATQPNNNLLVTGYDEEWPQFADLKAFLTLERPDISPNTTFSVVSLDGGSDMQLPFAAGEEANLDTQYTVGLATGVPVEFLTVGGDFETGLLDTTTYLDGVDNPPTVMTTSYAEDEEDFGISLATMICNGYMALGARGISILFASGDGGVRDNRDNNTECEDNTFVALFPASCPYVTAAGSTLGVAPEVAANFTGGGFSNFFPAPSYQSVAVSTFLATGIPSGFAGTFNQTGRGYPDVATQGVNFEISSGGVFQPVSGTSASSPTFASLVALLNDQLLAAGKPILGFLNPFLYGAAAAGTGFTDITSGHNSGDVCPASSVAFDATVGWDPLTGSGTPIYSELLGAALAT
ncbi:family S53 protease-like protein [Mycena galopus ATCC 62051]|nr:family S53 protease-like protein [Mycena galopus ATCC 62051]